MAPSDPTARPALRLLDGALSSVEYAWFCGHCAASYDGAPAPAARVCSACGLGVLLETREDVAPGPGEAFVVIDGALSIHAVSQGAERLLSTSEEMALGRPVTELLVPADAEALGPSSFAGSVLEVMASEEPARVVVRPWNTFGVRMRAQIGSCGPPRAALVVLDSGTPGLRLVEGGSPAVRLARPAS